MIALQPEIVDRLLALVTELRHSIADGANKLDVRTSELLELEDALVGADEIPLTEDL